MGAFWSATFVRIQSSWRFVLGRHSCNGGRGRAESGRKTSGGRDRVGGKATHLHYIWKTGKRHPGTPTLSRSSSDTSHGRIRQLRYCILYLLYFITIYYICWIFFQNIFWLLHIYFHKKIYWYMNIFYLYDSYNLYAIMIMLLTCYILNIIFLQNILILMVFNHKHLMNGSLFTKYW